MSTSGLPVHYLCAVRTHVNTQVSLKKVRCTPEKQGLLYRAEPAHIGTHTDCAGKHRAHTRLEPDQVPVLRQEVDKAPHP